jgi:hypothetical protein
VLLGNPKKMSDTTNSGLHGIKGTTHGCRPSSSVAAYKKAAYKTNQRAFARKARKSDEMSVCMCRKVNGHTTTQQPEHVGRLPGRLTGRHARCTKVEVISPKGDHSCRQHRNDQEG